MDLIREWTAFPISEEDYDWGEPKMCKADRLEVLYELVERLTAYVDAIKDQVNTYSGTTFSLQAESSVREQADFLQSFYALFSHDTEALHAANELQRAKETHEFMCEWEHQQSFVYTKAAISISLASIAAVSAVIILVGRSQSNATSEDISASSSANTSFVSTGGSSTGRDSSQTDTDDSDDETPAPRLLTPSGAPTNFVLTGTVAGLPVYEHEDDVNRD